jgi:very-short-patch-repair endonuclease
MSDGHPSADLIVELDGSQHAENPADKSRDRWLALRGYRVLRVWNNALTETPASVLDSIRHALEERS